MPELTARLNRAAESILENESLTADLDDPSAQVLLDWGLDCARMIARSTLGLNADAAEQAMSLRLRATRCLMRRVNRWAGARGEADAERGAEFWDDVVEQAAIVYGAAFTPPDAERRETFLRLHLAYADDPQGLISGLRQLLESQPMAYS
jgi:hypothetical protein